MKNIQVIDGALNCTFSIFQATDEEFALLFPEPHQDIQYGEDLASLPRQEEVEAALRRIWERSIRKQDAQGIHGTLDQSYLPPLLKQCQSILEAYPIKGSRDG